MNRRRRATGSRLLFTPALALVAVTLSGCGGPTLLGSAAVVNGERISLSEIEGTIEAVRDQQEAAGAADPPTQNAARNEVHRRVTGLVFAQAARELGVTVTDGELDARAAQERAAAGSEEAFVRGFSLQNRITPEQVYSELRRALIVAKLTEKVAKDAGVATDDSTVRDRLTAFLVQTAQNMDIKINPRYGAFDPVTGDIAEPAPDYFRPVDPAAAPAEDQP